MYSYQQGETVPEGAYLYDENDALTNAATVTITIKDPEGTTIIDGESMTNDAIGTYSYNYDLASDAEIGLWKIIVTVTLDSIITIRNDSFMVIP